jgi:cob(I)alamin adenosyltransferase
VTEKTENLILEILKRIQGDMADMKADVSDIKLRVTATEEHLATMMMSIAGLNSRLDKLDGRVLRIERRLELTEAK